MKHLICSIILFSVLSTTFCQSKISYGINAGYTNAGSLVSNKRTHSYSFRSISGVTAGLFLEIPLVGGLSIQPEVNFTQNGMEAKHALENNWTTYRRNAIDIPLNIAYNITVGEGRIYLAASPYYGIQMSVNNNDGKFYDATTNPSDYGLGFNLGYKWNGGYGFFIGSNYGMKDMSVNENVKLYNRTFNVGLRFDLHQILKK